MRPKRGFAVRGKGKGRGQKKPYVRHGFGTQKTTTKDAQLKKAIIKFLCKKKGPQKTIAIAHGCGYTTTKEVNPTLYALAKKKIVVKVNESPPIWTLDKKNIDKMCLGDSDEEMEDNFQNSETSSNLSLSTCYSLPTNENLVNVSSGTVKLFGAHGENLFEEPTLQGTEGFESENLLVENSLDQDNSQVEVGLKNVQGRPEGLQELEEDDVKENEGVGVQSENVEMEDDLETDGEEVEAFSPGHFTLTLQERLGDVMSFGAGNFDDSEDFSYTSSGQEELNTADVSEGICSETEERLPDTVSLQPDCVQSDEHCSGATDTPATVSSAKENPETDWTFEDKLLQTLAKRFLATAASFVLAKQMDCSKESVEDALKKLEEKKLVTRNGSAWQVTKTGDEYLRSRNLEPKEKVAAAPNVQQERTVCHVSKTGVGRGLPLSPAELAQSNTVFANKDAPFAKPAVAVGRGATLQKALEVSKMAGLSLGRGSGLLSAKTSDPSHTNSFLSNSASSNNDQRMPLGNSPSISQQSQNFVCSSQQNMTPRFPQQTGLGSSLCNGIRSPTSLPSPRFDSPPSLMTIANQNRVLPPPPPSVLLSAPQSASSSSPASSSLPFLSSLPSSSSQINVPQLTNSSAVSQPNFSTASSGMFANIGISSESFAALNKNPISALTEYAQSRHTMARIEVINQRGPPHKPTFEMACFVGSRRFPSVICQNKKDGRKEAADVAMRTLIAEGAYNVAEKSSLVSVPPSQMTHFDRVAGLVHQAFNALIASIPEALAGRKIIAGLVMKRHNNDVGVVISIGSGNRCITGQQLSLEGNTVNDSHAEIVTRRSFIRFLYKQLESYDPSRPHGLFEKGPTGRLRIRPTITFHLYISTAPCGDGALFSPRDTGSNNSPLVNVDSREHHPTFTSTVQGLLRTKMEGGEGTIPIEPDFVEQTFDGIIRGERLRTMSCTDKICRWNVVGMQGALLSHFIEPVYLDSLTLGFLYDHGHLARAVCCRVNRTGQPIDEMLPTGYHLNHPWLGRVTACDPSRETQKTKNLSINWSFGDQQPEVVDGPLGLCHTGIEKKFFSRITKKSMYESFKKVCVKFNRSDLAQAENYHQAKMAAKDFQAAKLALFKKLKENKYGPWVSKPVEEEMFS